MRALRIKYALASAVGAAVALAVFFSKNLFAETDALRIYRVLCDGFFLPAVLLIGVGLMVFVSNEGMFNILGYSVKYFGLFLFNRKVDKEREQYADYVKKKREKRASFGFLLVTGAAFMALAIVFLILFTVNS